MLDHIVIDWSHLPPYVYQGVGWKNVRNYEAVELPPYDIQFQAEFMGPLGRMHRNLADYLETLQNICEVVMVNSNSVEVKLESDADPTVCWSRIDDKVIEAIVCITRHTGPVYITRILREGPIPGYVLGVRESPLK